VDLEEVTNGVRWRLRAEQALMYDQEGRTNLRNLTVRVFQKDRSWTILGDEGDLDQKTKNVEVRKNVVITSSDGLRMDTNVIHWDADAQRLWTDEPVTLSRDGSVIQGTAFDMTTDDENATVAGRVRATSTRAATVSCGPCPPAPSASSRGTAGPAPPAAPSTTISSSASSCSATRACGKRTTW